MSSLAPLAKIKSIILYFCENTDPKFLGKVKLMKLFYFLDFGHVKKYGTPVTYDQYFNLEHGPVPSVIKNLIDTAADDIDESKLADTISFEKPKRIGMFRILAAKKFSDIDRGHLSESELSILAEVCQRFGDKNTSFVEAQSHQESPWGETKLLDRIPYTLAAKDKDCLVDEEIIEMSTSL